MRALAVVAVIANHLLGWPTGGFVGVDVFFVISGFLITGILIRERDRTGAISFRGFYVRRARRILPAAALVLGATVVLSVLLLGRTRAVSVVYDAVFALFFSANWRMAAVGTDYFQLGLPPSPLQHYWSLSVEEQFYFVWPLLLVGALALAARSRWGQRASWLFVAVALGLVMTASLVWAFFDTAVDPTVAYFSTFTRGWELAFGALVAVVAPYLTKIPGWIRPFLAWLGLLGILASLFVIDSKTPVPAPGVLLPVIATGLVIAAGTGRVGPRYNVTLFPLTNRAVTYVGDISYSLYLWHFPVIVLGLAFFAEGSRSYIAACVAGTAVLSVLTYHLVEGPIRRSRWLQAFGRRERQTVSPVERRRARRVFVGVGVAVLVVVAVSAASLNAPQPATSALTGRCVGAAAAGANWARCASVVATSVIPAVGDLQLDTAGAYACWRPAGGAYKSCTYGSSRSDAVRIALIGDSHAAMLIPALMPALVRNNWSLTTYLGNGCQWRDAPGTDCAVVMKQFQAHLLDSHYDDVITTSARWTNGSHPASEVPQYVRLWDPIAAKGTKIIVVDDTPTESASALQCVVRVGADPANSDCGTSRAVALAVVDPLPLAAAKVAGSANINLTDYFCSSSCPAVIGGVIVYRDAVGHMTGSYSRTLSPFLVARVQKELAPHRQP